MRVRLIYRKSNWIILIGGFVFIDYLHCIGHLMPKHLLDRKNNLFLFFSEHWLNLFLWIIMILFIYNLTPGFGEEVYSYPFHVFLRVSECKDLDSNLILVIQFLIPNGYLLNRLYIVSLDKE